MVEYLYGQIDRACLCILAERPTAELVRRNPDEWKGQWISKKRPQSLSKNAGARDPGEESRQKEMQTQKRRTGGEHASGAPKRD